MKQINLFFREQFNNLLLIDVKYNYQAIILFYSNGINVLRLILT